MHTEYYILVHGTTDWRIVLWIMLMAAGLWHLTDQSITTRISFELLSRCRRIVSHVIWREGIPRVTYILSTSCDTPTVFPIFPTTTSRIHSALTVFCTNTWLMRIYTPGGARTAEQGLAGSVSLQSGPGKAFHRLALTGSAFSTYYYGCRGVCYHANSVVVCSTQ